MQTVRSGLSNVVVLAGLAGLAVFLIVFFSHINSGSIAPNSSPLATPVTPVVQISPLPTPNQANVSLARIGAPVLVHSSGPAGLLNGDQQMIASVSRKDDQSYTTVLDLITGKESKIADTTLLNEHFSGHWLVGEDQTPSGSPGYYSRIKVIDVDTGKELFLGDKNTIQQSPSISGNIVVWKDWRNQNKSGTDIYAYDLTTGKEFPVVATTSWELEPRISGQWVTYLMMPIQQRPGEATNTIELRVHSLKTDEDFSIGWIPSPNQASWGTYHAIDGDTVAWIKVTNATWPQYASEPHLYDLTTHTDRQLAEPIQNGAPTDVSLSVTSGVVVYNSPTERWVVLDWIPSTPVSIPVTAPMKSIGDYLIASGNYLVWKINLNRDASDVKVFAEPITRP